MAEIELSSLSIANYGPDLREIYLNKVAETFEGKEKHSIYYQTRVLFSMTQDRCFRMPKITKRLDIQSVPFFDALELEGNSTNNNKLLQYAIEMQKSHKTQLNTDESEFCGILNSISDPLIGFKKIIDTCNQFPKEWTIIQVVKGPQPQTTYADFETIQQQESDIYLTMLQHARSFDYPEPISLRFTVGTQVELFKMFSKISTECKDYMQVSAADVQTHSAKAKYWENLKKLDDGIRQAITELREYIFPWLYLFKGSPKAFFSKKQKIYKYCFNEVDKLCDLFQLDDKERVLLSLASLHIGDMDDMEIECISEEFTKNEKAQSAALELLQRLRTFASLNSFSTLTNDTDSNFSASYNYPCVLIVDEHLDHFYWEELNVSQEMSRVNSLQCLWNLYKTYRSHIKNGYFCVNVRNGACVLNPDNNLPKTEMRLRSFFEHWTPSWLIKCKQKPTYEELTDFFKRSCYVYAGHGSGLQHVNGKHITKQNIDAIVFLFGCDSTRLLSNGLYSDLIGSHFYYHAAMCPCLVGAILPALDSQMDCVAVELLSRWIAPDSKNTSWQTVDTQLWMKKGIVQQLPNPPKEEPRMGSLCGVLTRIHLRGKDKYYYNTVPYVCRGLPVWNCDVEELI